MKKKWIFIISAVLIICLVFGGIVAFRKVRDYAAGKVIQYTHSAGNAENHIYDFILHTEYLR